MLSANNLLIVDQKDNKNNRLKDFETPENQEPVDQAQLENIINSKTDDELRQALMKAVATEIEPQPGFVVKTFAIENNAWAAKGDKVFINICQSPHVPPPTTATKEQVEEAMQGIDNGYRVPISLSQCRNDRDKQGKSCVVVDACVHSDALNKCMAELRYRGFIVELAMVWVEEKHGFLLSRDFSLPKMKSKGRLEKHLIYKKSAITEETEQNSSGIVENSVIEEVAIPEPSYHLLIEPVDAKEPEFLILTVDMPELQQKFSTFPNAKLELSHLRLNLSVDSLYKLDIKLPAAVDLEESGAQFDCKARVLTVTMPVLQNLMSL